jgi:prolyl-tRNA synthetase
MESAVSALSMTAEVLPKIVIVVDEAIASSDEAFAVRARTNEATVFLAGKDIYAYLQSLQAGSTSDQTKNIHVINFAALAAESAASSGATEKAAAPTKKVEARIEDAHQLAIGVKKEVDFSSWYTNVGPFFTPLNGKILRICSRSSSSQI